MPIGEGTIPTPSSDLRLPVDGRGRRTPQLQQNHSLGRALNRPSPQEFSVEETADDDRSSSRWDAAKTRLTRAVAGGRSTQGPSQPEPRTRTFLENMFAEFGGGRE